jgi:hypothetical protein
LSEQDVIRLIGEKFAALEYLEWSLKAMKVEDAVAELKRCLPGLKGVIKNRSLYSRSHVTKIVSF